MIYMKGTKVIKMENKINIKEVKEKLSGLVDTVSQKNGIFTVRKGYFYRHGMSQEILAEKIKEIMPNVEIIDTEDHWASFRGGASVAQGSHFMVKFKVEVQ